MVRPVNPPKVRVRLKLLAHIGKEISQKESELVVLRQTQIKLVKQYERAKYADGIERLRALVGHDEGGL